MEIHNSFHLNFSKEKFQFFGWNSNTKIFQPKPKIFPLGNATAWCPGRWNSRSHALISLYAPWYSWFPFFQMKAAASLKLYFLIPGGTHTREMNGDLRLKNTNKFPHYPFRLYTWKHFGFQERPQEKGFPGKKALFQGKFIIENLWFLSTGSFRTAISFQVVELILLFSIIPDSHAAWVQLAIAARLPKLSRRKTWALHFWGVLKWTPQSCKLWQQSGLVRGIAQGTESVPSRISD